MQSNLALPFRSQKFGRRETLTNKANALWKIDSGVVRTMTWLEDGTTVTLGLWGAEDVVGKTLSHIEPYQIECLTVVEATLISSNIWHQDTDALLAHLYQAEEFTLIRSQRRVEEMMLKLFAWLAKKFGHKVKEGHLIDVRLTHQDIADLLGTTRVTVTRLLKQFEEQGYVQRLPRHFTILHAEEFWHYEI